MGFWSGLGKGLLTGGAAIAAPFTGGASLATILPALLAGGGAIAAGASGGRAQGRAAEAGINQSQDALGLQAARLNLGAPQQRAQNATRGDLLANLQDVSVGAPRGTRLSGGTRPSLLSSDTRALGKQMSRDAYLSQMKGDAFTPTPLPQSGKTDTLLNILGGIGMGANALNSGQPQAQAPAPPPLLPGRKNPWEGVWF